MTIKFAPELEQKVSSIEEAQEVLAKKFKCEPHETPITELNVTEEYHILHGTTDYSVTRRAMEGLLRRLGIPPKFAFKIPEDLLDIIVRRLREVEPQTVQLFTKGKTIYGIAGGRYEAPNLSMLLDPLQTEANGAERQLKLARVGTEGFRLATIGVSSVEARKGDVIRAGIYIRGCHTGRPLPMAALMTYRLVCSNGAVVGKRWGELKWPRSIEDSEETREQMFITGLERLVHQEQNLLAPIKEMANRHLLDLEFVNVWKNLRKLVGPDSADALLQAKPDERRKIIAQVLARRRSHEGEPQLVSLCSTYEVFNNVSEKANHVPGAQAEKLQKVAGLLLGGAAKREEIEEET